MATGIFKIFLSIIFANGIRLLRFVPNNDPIMSMMLPFSKQDKIYVSILFPVLTMISFDFITGMVGPWTIITSATYGFLGLFFYLLYRRMKKVGMKQYLGSGVLGVLIFDFVTGVLGGPIMFGISFQTALIGQIPFTILHLITVTGFIVLITPLLDKHILTNGQLDDAKVMQLLFRLKLNLFN